MSYQVKTPVLFLAFNRPDCTEQVFDSIRKVKPHKLYVAIDGPRENREDDVANREKVLKIVRNVEWDCETHYLIHEKNLGCSLSGVTAWRWFFENEDRMLFIEDDGLGNESAFRFIDEMMEKYENDQRILNVGAVNYGPTFGKASFFYTRHPACTYFMGVWKRVMDKYEYDLDSYPMYRCKKSFRKNFLTLGEYLVSIANFDNYVKSIKEGKRENTYDLQLDYLAYRDNMYSIYPNINMVSNIGLAGGANNSLSTESAFYKEYANRKRYEIDKIIYTDLEIDKEFEKKYYKKRVLYNKSWVKVWLSSAAPDWIKIPIRYLKTIVR